MANELVTKSAVATAVVTFGEMEKMATAVAASGLFGVKTKESALALMLLAQSEQIHPMTAVRDYHIMDVKGRIIVSMKADAMLARFQEAGGKVDWKCLTDKKAEATFSHPSVNNPVTIDWTIERAQKAGLAGKDVWQAYPRAMLRNRVVSEGIRTTLPGVIVGKYTPEEAMNIETVEPINVQQAIESFERPGLSAEDAQRHMDIISKSIGMETLKDGFGKAYTAAKAVGDEARMDSFKLAYESRKGELAEAEKAIAAAIEAKQPAGEQI